MQKKIAFQGEKGAYGHEVCKKTHPNMEPLAVASFDEAITAVKEGLVELAMLPIENSTYGRVADIHRLLPASGLYIQGEYFMRVHINLVAPKGAVLENIKTAQSHTVLLGQCSKFLKNNGIKPIIGADTAGSARLIAKKNDPSAAALASDLAAEIYRLDILARHIEDDHTNTTRFLVMSRDNGFAPLETTPVMTSFVFQVRNIPAALYKALGGFATNGVNMTKLESYMIGNRFAATQFYADIVGHPEEEKVIRAFEELEHFTEHFDILGVYACQPRD